MTDIERYGTDDLMDCAECSLTFGPEAAGEGWKFSSVTDDHFCCDHCRNEWDAAHTYTEEEL